jgi:hypothetical protein
LPTRQPPTLPLAPPAPAGASAPAIAPRRAPPAPAPRARRGAPPAALFPTGGGAPDAGKDLAERLAAAVAEPPPVQPPPEPLAIMHSGAFMRQKQRLPVRAPCLGGEAKAGDAAKACGSFSWGGRGGGARS